MRENPPVKDEEYDGKSTSFVPYDGSYSHLMGDMKPTHLGSQSQTPTKQDIP